MKSPMGLNSTPLLSYRQIKTDRIDLYEDAFGIYCQFDDVIGILNRVRLSPGRKLTKRLIARIRNQDYIQ